MNGSAIDLPTRISVYSGNHRRFGRESNQLADRGVSWSERSARPDTQARARPSGKAGSAQSPASQLSPSVHFPPHCCPSLPRRACSRGSSPLPADTLGSKALACQRGRCGPLSLRGCASRGRGRNAARTRPRAPAAPPLLAEKGRTPPEGSGVPSLSCPTVAPLVTPRPSLVVSCPQSGYRESRPGVRGAMEGCRLTGAAAKGLAG